MISAFLLAFIFVAIVITVVWCDAQYGIDLARRDINAALSRALKIFLLLSFATGMMTLSAVYQGSLKDGLRGLYRGLCHSFGIFFWMAFAGQIIALGVFILVWVKRRHDRQLARRE